MPNNTITLLNNNSLHVFRARMKLIAALKYYGYHVIVISAVDGSTKDLRDAGVEHIHVDFSQYGMNPIKETRNIIYLKNVFRSVDPLVSLHFTVKPNTFGNIAARHASVPVINNIAGAGRGFSSGTVFTRSLVRKLYRVGLSTSRKVLFQNPDDMANFLNARIVTPECAEVVPGSGVDLQHYAPTPIPNGPTRFLFIGRLLLEKGIVEFLEAANELLVNGSCKPQLEFHVIGEHEDHRYFIDANTLYELSKPSQIFIHGAVPPTAVSDHIRNASCVVLPTYYGEGVPRALLESCASGRPIITTDSIGSKEVVEHGLNGLKVPPRDAGSLARAMSEFASYSLDRKTRMAVAARETAKSRFDEKIVINRYLDLIRGIENGSDGNSPADNGV